jgi:hypothetical protein
MMEQQLFANMLCKGAMGRLQVIAAHMLPGFVHLR